MRRTRRLVLPTARLRTPRRRRIVRFEPLEPRWLLTCDLPDCVAIPLFPEFDQFGAQVETVHAYEDGDETRVAFAIYDTGASVITFSASDQLLFEFTGSPIPVKVPGGATADAIGGTLIGDVSAPATILADGLHAVDIDGSLNIGINLDSAAEVPGIQSFIGTPEGSVHLPTITGTPIHLGSVETGSGQRSVGVAAQVIMESYEVDFGELFPEIPEFKDIVIQLPDLTFVAPNTPLPVPQDNSTTQPLRIPLALFGDDNTQEPGDQITSWFNPVQPEVHLIDGAFDTAQPQTFLFDTGAQLSVISTAIAIELGLDLNSPEQQIDVFGAGGTTKVSGFTLDALELPLDNDGDGASEARVQFTDVPVYVLDFFPGLDGILGMNLFNGVHSLQFDPFDANGASVSMAFLNDRNPQPPDDGTSEAEGHFVATFPALSGSLGGQALPSFSTDDLPVHDPQLTIVADQPEITESDGMAAAMLTVARGNVDTSQSLIVSLASSDETELKVPAEVTIPANMVSVQVPIDAVDDSLLDGSQSVTIRATANGLLAAEDVVRVNDMEELAITLTDTRLREGIGAGVATATLTRMNTDIDEALQVSLFASDPTELTVPSAVTIPGGESSVPFFLDVQNDHDVDGDQTVTISAAAAGYVDATASVVIVDDDPHAWNNPVEPRDVNASGGITVQDAALLISTILVEGPHVLSLDGPGPQSRFLDVVADGIFDLRDVAPIISHLLTTPAAEGEAIGRFDEALPANWDAYDFIHTDLFFSDILSNDRVDANWHGLYDEALRLLLEELDSPFAVGILK